MDIVAVFLKSSCLVYHLPIVIESYFEIILPFHTLPPSDFEKEIQGKYERCFATTLWCTETNLHQHEKNYTTIY